MILSAEYGGSFEPGIKPGIFLIVGDLFLI